MSSQVMPWPQVSGGSSCTWSESESASSCEWMREPRLDLERGPVPTGLAMLLKCRKVCPGEAWTGFRPCRTRECAQLREWGGGARGSRSCCWQMFTATPGTKKAADQGRGAGSSGRSRCRAAGCPGTASQAGRPRAIAAAGTATLRAANTAAGGVVGRAHSRFPQAQQQPLFAAGRAGRAMDARSPPPRPRSLVREPDLPRCRPGRPRAMGPGARGARGNGSASAGATTAKASPQSGALARAHGQRLGWREQRRLPTQLRRLPRSPKLCASMASGAVEAARAAKRRRSARLEPRGKIAGRLRCACSAGGARASGVAVGAHE